MRRVLVLVVLAGLAGCGGGSRPPARPAVIPGGPVVRPTAAPLPAGPSGLAADLAATDRRLAAAVDAWRRAGTDRPAVPAAVAGPARRQQAIYRRLVPRRALTRRIVARLPRGLRAATADVVAAQAAIHVLNKPQRTSHARRMVRLGPAEPPAALLAHYREGARRSGVPWPLLAAINLVESDFGRLRNDSIAGAQGPMQFIASTWRTYGRGDVHDPRQAILGAARFLRAAGAPRDDAAALLAYDPSPLYVAAVSRYARTMAADPRAFYAFYAWTPPVRRR
jgi:membrane-bound lytic murein transglycosylase B